MKLSIKQYNPNLPEFKETWSLFSYWTNYFSLLNLDSKKSEIDRICLDRFLLIRERIFDQGWVNTSILDLGGGGGYFSWLFYLTVACQVDMVEDERAKLFGYNEASFLTHIEEKKNVHLAEQLVIHKQTIESFLNQKAGLEKWDIVICLSVLHHFLTGYGDDSSIGKLDEESLMKIFQQFGMVARKAVFIEVDPERIKNYEKFIRDLMKIGGFSGMSILGSSHSGIGVERNIIELIK